MSQQASTAVGQVSADGQFRWDGAQWVPIPQGTREATLGTRPMQLAAAALLTVEAVTTVAVYVLFYNHDAARKALEASGQRIPSGTTEDQLIAISIASAIGVAVVLALIELFGALGAFLRWRWAFWYVLVLMGLGTLSSIFGLYGLFRASSSPFPLGAVVLQEVLALAAIPIFIWMLLGVVTRGPWAMKRPGAL